jgi:hypothetical protein
VVALRCGVWIAFKDVQLHLTNLAMVPANAPFALAAHIPVGAAAGTGQVQAILGVPITGCREEFSEVPAETAFAVNTGPGIFGFTPRSGPVGTVVRITGVGFTGATAVTFQGVSAAFSVVSDSRITATVPIGASSGRVRIVTASGATRSGLAFQVT